MFACLISLHFSCLYGIGNTGNNTTRATRRDALLSQISPNQNQRGKQASSKIKQGMAEMIDRDD